MVPAPVVMLFATVAVKLTACVAIDGFLRTRRARRRRDGRVDGDAGRARGAARIQERPNRRRVDRGEAMRSDGERWHERRRVEIGDAGAAHGHRRADGGAAVEELNAAIARAHRRCERRRRAHRRANREADAVLRIPAQRRRKREAWSWSASSRRYHDLLLRRVVAEVGATRDPDVNPEGWGRCRSRAAPVHASAVIELVRVARAGPFHDGGRGEQKHARRTWRWRTIEAEQGGSGTGANEVTRTEVERPGEQRSDGDRRRGSLRQALCVDVDAARTIQDCNSVGLLAGGGTVNNGVEVDGAEAKAVLSLKPAADEGKVVPGGIWVGVLVLP